RPWSRPSAGAAARSWRLFSIVERKSGGRGALRSGFVGAKRESYRSRLGRESGWPISECRLTLPTCPPGTRRAHSRRVHVMNEIPPDVSRLDLSTVLEAVANGVTIVDASGRIVYSNPAADRILGTPANNDPPDRWAERYGVLHPNGDEPFQAGDYP